MNKVATKIVILMSLFLVFTLGITAFSYVKLKDYGQLPGCATITPKNFCGTEKVISKNRRIGKGIFNTNCASCHKLNKKMTGPSLRGIVQNKNYPSRAFIIQYIRDEQKLIDEKNEYVLALNKEYSFSFIHRFKLNDLEIEQLLEYIAD